MLRPTPRLLFAALLLAPAAHAAETTRVSVSSAGAQAGGVSTEPALSANGRFAVFTSLASNLVPVDTNDASDVFLHDRKSGQTVRVSVSTGGVQVTGDSGEPAISANGRFVAFASQAANLVPGDGNGTWDIFVHDRKTVSTRRVSVSSGGVEGNGLSSTPSISANGRFVAFTSMADNLVADDTNAGNDVFVHDLKTGKTSRVSVSSAGEEGDISSFQPSISSSGRFVAFASAATNLVPGDSNGEVDVFVHDRKTGKTTMLSLSPGGLPGSDQSQAPSISANGRLVAFRSFATNLVPDDANLTADIFVADRKTRKLSLVSLGPEGIQANQFSSAARISGNGRFVAFLSDATNLVADDDNAASDIYVRDLKAATTTRASVSTEGGEGNSSSIQPAISATGRFAAFASTATNLVPDDSNGAYDIFVRDRK